MRLVRLRGGLGLRGRIVGALLFTTVSTLAVAAGGLLGPLEHQLRNAALKTLVSDLRRRGATAGFRRLDLRFVLDRGPADPLSGNGPGNHGEGHLERRQLARREQTLGAALGATVALFGSFDAAGQGHRVPTFEPATDEQVLTPDVRRAYLTRRLVESFGTDEGVATARVAVPLTIQRERYVLALSRPITQVAGAVHVVRTAFIEAAMAGFLLTLLLGIPLSGRLVRRLRRLRQAAVRLSPSGLSVEVPEDRARDEVGDLARALTLMQHRLRSQEEARRSFVATASHELRTPLTSLEGMLELLEDDLQLDHPDLDDARDLLSRARAQSDRLVHLAGDLLDLSRIDAEVPLRSEPVEFAELSRAVLAEFERGSRSRGVRTVLELPDGTTWALGDPGSVARILRILIDNALRISAPGDAITVAVGVAGDQARLSVADEGPGVDPGEQQLIFERFHRGRNTAGESGFGLGLAIGRELAMRMQGVLELDPDRAKGAMFTLTLPLAVAPDRQATARV